MPYLKHQMPCLKPPVVHFWRKNRHWRLHKQDLITDFTDGGQVTQIERPENPNSEARNKSQLLNPKAAHRLQSFQSRKTCFGRKHCRMAAFTLP
jgi:hypothetical protein